MDNKQSEGVCDDTVFEQLYRTHAKNLHDFLFYKYGGEFNPADKAQEAFIILWENCSKISKERAKSYLFKVANNLMLNEAKHQKIIMAHRAATPNSKTDVSPEYLMEQEEYFKKYQACLSKMSEEQRTAFLLNKVEGKKHQEIADLLGVSRKVVEYRIYSAFDILRKDLENFKIK